MSCRLLKRVCLPWNNLFSSVATNFVIWKIILLRIGRMTWYLFSYFPTSIRIHFFEKFKKAITIFWTRKLGFCGPRSSSSNPQCPESLGLGSRGGETEAGAVAERARSPIAGSSTQPAGIRRSAFIGLFSPVPPSLEKQAWKKAEPRYRPHH